MSHNAIEIVLDGNIPSKKNSRINRRDGLSFPSAKYREWEKYALLAVRMQTKIRFINPVHMDIVIYFGTNIRADLDNRLSSILDMLVDSLIICDDKWQYVPSINLRAEYRKGKPGASIKIFEINK